MTRMLLVFGVAFEIPLFVVLLNLAGVVSGRTLGAHRPWIVVGTFVFAAVATPSTDPFSMLMLARPDDAAVPGLGGHRPARRPPAPAVARSTGIPDDEASVLEPDVRPVRRSGLNQDEDDLRDDERD